MATPTLQRELLNFCYTLSQYCIILCDKYPKSARSVITLSSSPVTEAWEYIESTRDGVCDLEHRVQLAKANVDTMCSIMAGWSKVPLYRRKNNKKETLLNFEVLKYVGSYDFLT